MTLPNFLIIGAAKCGTDALYAYLGQHPQIYMSPTKETNFFIVEGQPDIPYCGPRDREILQECWVPTLSAYEELFAGANGEVALGEASPWYIYDPNAARRIARRLPNPKLIAILRNPADRAFSAFTSLIRDGRETFSDVSAALDAEESRVAARWEPLWHLTRMGFYSGQVQRYYDAFDSSQIRVIVYDDFVARPRAVLQDLFAFLEVDTAFVPDMSKRPNVSLIPKNGRYHDFLTRPNPFKELVKPLLPTRLRQRVKASLVERSLTRPSLDQVMRQRLMAIFRDDILRLQDVLERDLSAWLTTSEPGQVSDGTHSGLSRFGAHSTR